MLLIIITKATVRATLSLNDPMGPLARHQVLIGIYSSIPKKFPNVGTVLVAEDTGVNKAKGILPSLSTLFHDGGIKRICIQLASAMIRATKNVLSVEIEFGCQEEKSNYSDENK